jgi:hypothetical protein
VLKGTDKRGAFMLVDEGPVMWRYLGWPARLGLQLATTPCHGRRRRHQWRCTLIHACPRHIQFNTGQGLVQLLLKLVIDLLAQSIELFIDLLVHIIKQVIDFSQGISHRICRRLQRASTMLTDGRSRSICILTILTLHEVISLSTPVRPNLFRSHNQTHIYAIIADFSCQSQLKPTGDPLKVLIEAVRWRKV